MIIFTSPAHQLKFKGRLIHVPLSKVSDTGVTMQQLEQLQKDFWCLHPDHPDPEIAEADDAHIGRIFGCDEDTAQKLRSMHMRYLNSESGVGALATGKGSWPPGKICHPALYGHENYHATTLSIDTKSFLEGDDDGPKTWRAQPSDDEIQRQVVDAKVWPDKNNPVKDVAEAKRIFSYGHERMATFDRPQWAQISGARKGDPYNRFWFSTWLALETTRRAGCLYIQIFNGRGNVHELAKRIPGGVAGFAYFNDGTCGDRVTSNIDTLIRYTIGWSALLRSHEWGHTLNLPHTFANQNQDRSVMGYNHDYTPFQGYREEGAPYKYVIDPSWNRLWRFFGREPAKPIVTPTDPIPPDPIPPTPPGGNIEIVGGLVQVKFSEPVTEFWMRIIQGVPPLPNTIYTREDHGHKFDS